MPTSISMPVALPMFESVSVEVDAVTTAIRATQRWSQLPRCSGSSEFLTLDGSLVTTRSIRFGDVPMGVPCVMHLIRCDITILLSVVSNGRYEYRAISRK